MIYVRGCGKVLIDLEEVVEVVSNADDMLHPFLLRFLSYDELFDRVFMNKPDMRVSIEIVHSVIQSRVGAFGDLS